MKFNRNRKKLSDLDLKERIPGLRVQVTHPKEDVNHQFGYLAFTNHQIAKSGRYFVKLDQPRKNGSVFASVAVGCIYLCN